MCEIRGLDKILKIPSQLNNFVIFQDFFIFLTDRSARLKFKELDAVMLIMFVYIICLLLNHLKYFKVECFCELHLAFKLNL